MTRHSACQLSSTYDNVNASCESGRSPGHICQDRTGCPELSHINYESVKRGGLFLWIWSTQDCPPHGKQLSKISHKEDIEGPYCSVEEGWKTLARVNSVITVRQRSPWWWMDFCLRLWRPAASYFLVLVSLIIYFEPRAQWGGGTVHFRELTSNRSVWFVYQGVMLYSEALKTSSPFWPVSFSHC